MATPRITRDLPGTVKPLVRRRGKSAMAASRTGVPPAHGARRKGKVPGAPAGAFQKTVSVRRGKA